MAVDLTGHSAMPTDVETSALDGKTFFVCIGAMKSGTSWLHRYLRSHPHVFASHHKELNFFTRFVDNPLKRSGDRRRGEIIEKIVLRQAWRYPPPKRLYHRLKTVVEIEAMGSDVGAYKNYFARRVRTERAFGESSPSYSLLPAAGFSNMARVGDDLRLIFLMRDPTDRIASHIQHNWRRRPDIRVDAFIARLAPGSRHYDRSNYMKTIDAVRAGLPDTPFLCLIYEELFATETTERVCAFLDVPHHPPNLSKRVNAARGPRVEETDKARIREKLDPIYQSMADYFGDNRPAGWRW